MKRIKATVLLMTLALLLTATMSTTYGDDDAESNGLFSEVEGEPPPSAGVNTIASRLVQIDFQQLDRATKPPDVVQPATDGPLAEPPPPQKLSLNLFDDAVFTAIVQHVEPTSAGYVLWGGLEGMELGSVTMVVNGSVVAGTVRTPQAVYTIRSLSDGIYVIRQIDESSLPPPGEPPKDYSSAPDPLPQTTGERDDGSEIDVIVVYTPTAKHQAGGRAGVEALIDLFVAETNQAYAQSGVSHRIRLVYRDEVDYIENGDSYIDLARLEYSSDGYMDRVHELRELYAADLVHLLVGTSFNVCGVAQLLIEYEDGTFRDSAFGLTRDGCGGLVFAHELGHNMGLKHDRYQVLRDERMDSIDGYNYGYVNQRAFRLDAPEEARWRTIMAYNIQCSHYQIESSYCPRIPRFSNPELTYNGDRLGVPVNHPSGGVDGPAHAVRALNENRHVMANFRQSSTSTPEAGLTLSPYWLAENGGSSTVTAFLNRPASADTTVTVAVSHPGAVTLSDNRTLTIPAGRTASVGTVTLTGIDNGNQTGDVIVTVSANTSSEGIAGPELVELAIADDETTPVVFLSLSRTEVVARRWNRREDDSPPLDRTHVTATLDNRSSAATRLTVSAFPVGAVFRERAVPQSLTIPAGQTASDVPLWYIAVDDEMSRQARKSATVSATASNPQGVIAPEDVTLTILGGGPIFVDDSIEYTFTSGLSGARFLPEARYGYGQLTYSISPAPGNGMTFIPGQPARLVVPKTAAVAGTTRYTLTATDAQGYTDSMTVIVAVRGPVCPDSEAVRGYSGPGIIADCEALLAFNDGLYGDRPLNWSEHLAVDEWQGVSISDGRVVEINVTRLGLNGPIPSELGSLSNLRLLQLWNNQLNGPIPPELGNLRNLYALGLSYNLLTGQIPHSLSNLTNLQYLWLRGNQLTGCIPEALRNVERNDLHRLGLPFCDELPPCPHDCELLLGVMDILVGGGNAQLNWSAYVPISEWQGVTVSGTPPRVTRLNLRNADLRGSIPPLLGDLHNLRELDLSVNQLGGEIPTELGNLTGLTGLNLGNNRLSGKIPAALNNLTNLRWLSLSGNMLTGCVPPGLRDVQDNDFAALDLPFCSNRAALVALYDATDGANWTNNTNWNTGDPIGEWHGVTTDADGNVTALDLTSNQLSGQIPSSLDSLYDLQELRLGNHPLCDDEGSCNQLSGEIPSELGSLANLQGLYLNGNQLTGPIPSELGNLSNLTRLNLTWNGLTGPVPQELGSLASLEGLALGGNQLSGPIPAQLGAMTNLQELYLWRNQLTGPIPVELSRLPNLVNLELTGNQLTGPIPSGLGNLSNLITLDLARNRLTGPVPQELGSLTSLEELALGGNQLSGPIPPQLGNLANLQALFLWGNQLTGPIPAELSSLLHLVNLELNDNQLTGPIPSQLGSLTNLQRLLLFGNQLTGPIPSQLGGLARLQKLRLGNLGPCDDEDSCNQLSGEIPAELGSLANLKELSLTWNQLSGEIPAELAGLTSLEILALGGNQLTGTVPTWLGNLVTLEELYLWENELTGTIPVELGSLANLKELSLTRNQLSGEIPPELVGLTGLEILALGGNQLTGTVPTWLGSLANLEELYLWGNGLTGTIPAELGSLGNLKVLWLSENQLTGEIPVELGNLANLEELSLWENELTGEIPTELAGLTSLEILALGGNQLTGAVPIWLASLANLEELSLWGNELTGEIPVELGSLGNLKVLWLSENQLSGDIPAELAGLNSLEILALGGNQLAGEIPPELGSLANLVVLRLQGNQLSGDIPAELAGLTSLEILTLGGNQLSGGIPPELGNLANLVVLRLHGNQLTGEIPSELGELDKLVSVTFRGNQLTGCVPASLRDVDDNDFSQLGLPFCTPGDPLVARYDVNGNGIIERSEVIKAINDYLSGEGDPITRADVIRLINLYLSGQSVA